MVFIKYRKIFQTKNVLICLAMAGWEWRKFANVVALESLNWHSLALFHHQTQQYKQNLTNLNYVYGYIWPYPKRANSDLTSKRKYWRKLTPEFRIFTGKTSFMASSLISSNIDSPLPWANLKMAKKNNVPLLSLIKTLFWAVVELAT